MKSHLVRVKATNTVSGEDVNAHIHLPRSPTSSEAALLRSVQILFLPRVVQEYAVACVEEGACED